MMGRMVDLRLGSFGLANKNTEHQIRFRLQLNNKLIFKLNIGVTLVNNII